MMLNRLLYPVVSAPPWRLLSARKVLVAPLAILFFLLTDKQAVARKNDFSDSLIHLASIQPDYPQKIEFLQKNLRVIYTTRFDEVIELARFGYALAQKKEDKVNKGDFLRQIGLALGRKGNIDSALVYYYKALQELEPTQNTEKLGQLYDDMARTYRKLQQSGRALFFYDKALALYEKDENLEGIARINNESGVVFQEAFADYKSANNRFEKSLFIQIQRNDSGGIGYALEFLGYNQLLQKEYDKSLSYLTQALAIRQRLGDDFALMLNYTALGDYFSQTKQPLLSNEYLEKSNALARKINYLDIQQYNFEKMMSNYEALGNYEKAYHNLKTASLLKDSLYKAQTLKDVEEITTKYETAEKERQLAQKELSLKIRNQWIFGLTALVLTIGLMGFLLYKQQVLRNIKQQRDNELQLALTKIDAQSRLQQQRLSISRDLHDNIGAQLSFIVSAIDTIKYYMSDSHAPVSQRLTHVGSFAKETIRELRDTIWAMNKPDITIQDLQARIANFIEKAQLSYGNVRVSLAVDADIPSGHLFRGLEGLNIFRIIQEAVNNALKYAKATRIEIRIQKEGEVIHFQIEDNGEGFLENETEQGNGLQNMRKRALELGTELKVESALGKGTKVVFDVYDKKDRT